MSGDAFRVFGRDGTGGYAAFRPVRPVRPDAELVDQPVVFLGSEGKTGVVARNLSDFLWVLADGLGPLEATDAYDTGLLLPPERRADRRGGTLRLRPPAVVPLAAGAAPTHRPRVRHECYLA
ncbi:hypothetical protein [Streptomyces sp. NPDC018693]|uniref:hypothetical protein n=1 Tax=unclassified Streptomyces TaxID=2593676 RepID=UPI0037AEFFAD